MLTTAPESDDDVVAIDPPVSHILVTVMGSATDSDFRDSARQSRHSDTGYRSDHRVATALPGVVDPIMNKVRSTCVNHPDVWPRHRLKKLPDDSPGEVTTVRTGAGLTMTGLVTTTRVVCR